MANIFVSNQTIEFLHKLSNCDDSHESFSSEVHVCTYNEICNQTHHEEIDHAMEANERRNRTEWCGDFSSWFRCEKEEVVRKNVTFPARQVVTKAITKTVKTCCKGFYQTPEKKCEACLYGSYGHNCSFFCPRWCTKQKRKPNSIVCDNVIGCCQWNNQTCGKHIDVTDVSTPNKTIGGQQTRLPEDPVPDKGINITIGQMIGVAGTFSIIVFLLLLLAVYYRQKFKKERRASFYSVRYYSNKASLDWDDESGVDSNSNIISLAENGFFNPLFLFNQKPSYSTATTSSFKSIQSSNASSSTRTNNIGVDPPANNKFTDEK